VRAATVALAALLAAAPAFAQERPEPFDPYERGTISVELENDLFGFSGDDHHYTNGARISWLSAPTEPGRAGWERPWYDFWPILSRSGSRRIGFALGQNIYTPIETERPTPDPTDRPYAAWLYVGASVNTQTARRLDTLELDVGVVGPAAHGRQVQNGVHDLIGVNDSRGWDHQLKNEPGIMLIGERRIRVIEQSNLVGGVNTDLIGFGGASIGNVQTYGNIGLIVRIGGNLMTDFGPPHIRPSLPGSATFKPTDGFNWYLFAGAEARAVARDIFLDGNTWRDDSPSVDKKHLVGDFEVGLAMSYGTMRLALTQIFRTKEFEGQRANSRFGALALSWVF
jgi:lipid A 3-O-deacylase